MPATSLLSALSGGMLIGIAASGLLLLLGRIAGISGITANLLQGLTPANHWRAAFVAGLLTGGLILHLFYPDTFTNSRPGPWYLVAVAGLLVGYGTRVGSGCTSGHGICGLARRSPRSVYATLTFMLTGMLTVFLVRHLIGNP